MNYLYALGVVFLFIILGILTIVAAFGVAYGTIWIAAEIMKRLDL